MIENSIMDNQSLKRYLFRGGVTIGVVLAFWVPMVALYCKYADSLAVLGDDAEDVAEGYEVLLQRCLLATRIAGAVLLGVAFLYIIVQICRAIRNRRKHM